jgi:hypothetical protein
MSVVCCQIEVSATGRSLVQMSPTECGVSECDLEISTIRRPMPNRAVEPCKKKIMYVFNTVESMCSESTGLVDI